MGIYMELDFKVSENEFEFQFVLFSYEKVIVFLGVLVFIL